MGRRGKYNAVLAAFLMVSSSQLVVSQDLWSEVRLDKSSVYVGEPVKVTLTVYTSTWFTRGLDPGNIKVEGAFTTYFRPVSTSFVKDGQTYAGVQLIYHVFPYKENDILFPSLKIAVESPAEGDFKGTRHEVATAARSIRVSPVPSELEREQWLVTTGLDVSDNWQGDLRNVKVGDVLVRQITRTARGTVSELIPPIRWDSVANTSMYPGRSVVENKKSKTAIGAVRTETMRFLFEEEGEVLLPAMVFSWYDPVQKKLYKRTLEERTIQVQPNPDLGVLDSVRDSLILEQASGLEDGSIETRVTILGFTPGRFALLCLAALVLVFVLFRSARWFNRWRRIWLEQYRRSEAYYFKAFTKSVRNGALTERMRALYRWLDELRLPEPSISYFIENHGSEMLRDTAWNNQSGELSHGSLTASLLKEWRIARFRYLHGMTGTGLTKGSPWVNPANIKGKIRNSL